MVSQLIRSIKDIFFTGDAVLHIQFDDDKDIIVFLSLDIKVKLPDSRTLSGSNFLDAKGKPPIYARFCQTVKFTKPLYKRNRLLFY
jgi:hypothetical protein